jgi:hypothetical protein
MVRGNESLTASGTASPFAAGRAAGAGLGRPGISHQTSPIRAMLDSPMMLAVVKTFCTSRPGRTPTALMNVNPMIPSRAYLSFE